MLWEVVPMLVKNYRDTSFKVAKYITHKMKLREIKEAFDLLHSGKCLRMVMLLMSERTAAGSPKLESVYL